MALKDDGQCEDDKGSLQDQEEGLLVVHKQKNDLVWCLHGTCYKVMVVGSDIQNYTG